VPLESCKIIEPYASFSNLIEMNHLATGIAVIKINNMANNIRSNNLALVWYCCVDQWFAHHREISRREKYFSNALDLIV
jgi:hypothetical protein